MNNIGNDDNLIYILDVDSLIYAISDGKQLSFSRSDIYSIVNSFEDDYNMFPINVHK